MGYKRLLKRILKECKKYPYAFDKKALELFYVMPEQDETGYFEIKKGENKFSYYLGGNYFSNNKRTDIKEFEAQLKKFDVSPEKFAGYFVKALKKPLSESIAEKKLANLEKRLLS